MTAEQHKTSQLRKGTSYAIQLFYCQIWPSLGLSGGLVEALVSTHFHVRCGRFFELATAASLCALASEC